MACALNLTGRASIGVGAQLPRCGVGYSIEAGRDRSSDDETGPDEYFSTCAWRPRLHEALTAVCRQAAATNGWALLAFIATQNPLTTTDDRLGEFSVTIGLRRNDDVVDVCPAGVVLVAGGFSHPARCEAVVRRAVTRLGRGEDTSVGLAIFPTHGDRVAGLVASASASLRRSLAHRRATPSAARLSLVRPDGDASRPTFRPA